MSEEQADDPTHPPVECDHEWYVQGDWGGDPEVIGGTYDCSFWRCKLCGEEDHERPIEHDKLEDDVI